MAERSYVHGASGRPLIGKTISALFDETCAASPDRPALIVRHQQIRWTYAELKDRVDAFAAGLVALGLQPGDRIITSGHGGSFPVGIPVGEIISTGTGTSTGGVKVRPYADFSRLEFVRVVDYGVSTVSGVGTPPPARTR